MEHRMPSFDIAVEAPEPFFGRRFGRYACIVDESVQGPVEQRAGLGHKVFEVLRIAEIGCDVMGPVRVALALLRHRLPRAGDDPPTCVAETLDRGVPDPAACPGQQQHLSFTAHRAPTRRGKFARGSSIPSGSWWIITSAWG